MFALMCIFLGLATCIVAALLFFSLGRRTGQCAEVNFNALHAASECISAGRRGAMDSLSAVGKTRTVAAGQGKMAGNERGLDAVLFAVPGKGPAKAETNVWLGPHVRLVRAICLVNLVLEIEFGEPIRISSIRPRTGHQAAAASHLQSPQLQPSPSTSISIGNRFPRK